MKLAQISASSASKYYFEKDVIFNESGQNQNTGYFGVGADALGLQGAMKKEEFKNLLDGKSPDGTQLVKGGVTGDKRSAYDLPLSAPKSVSIAALVHGDDRLVKAHQDAVNQTLDYIEKNLIEARDYARDSSGKLLKGEDGKHMRIAKQTGNMVVAQAMHSTSRPVGSNNADPSLHTHNVIMNMTYDKDAEKFKAIHFDKLFENQSVVAEVYRSALAQNVKNLGYSIDTDSKGLWEISGIDKSVNENFSKRSTEIKAKMEELKAAGWKGTEAQLQDHVQHMLKQEKREDISKEDLIKDWKNQHNQIQKISDAQRDMKDISNFQNQKGEGKMTAKQALEKAAEFLTEKESVISKEALLKQALKESRGDLNIKDLEKELDNVKKIGQKEDSELKRLDDKHFTTKEMYDIEKDNLRMLKNQAKFQALMSPDHADRAIKAYEDKNGWKMTDGQRTAVKAVLTSDSQYLAIQGSAGVGKTTLLDSVRHATEIMQLDTELKVLAPTGKAAAEAKSASGIDSSTIDSHMLKTQKGENFYSAKKDAAGFSSVPKEHEAAFRDKFQIGGGIFGVGISKEGFSTIQKSVSRDWKGELTVTKNEQLRTGANAGATRTSTFKAHGDTTKNHTVTTLKNGTKIIKDSETWKPFDFAKVAQKNSTTVVGKDGSKSTYSVDKKSVGLASHTVKKSSSESNDKKNKIDVTDKTTSIFGFSMKSKTEEIKDKDGNLIAMKTTKENSFLGMKIGEAKILEVSKDGNKLTQATYKRDSKGNVSDMRIKEDTVSQKDLKQTQKDMKSSSEIKSSQKIMFVDESSMLSAKKMNALLKQAEENGSRLVFMGDSKQIQSIESGRAWEQLKENVNVVEVNQTVRQKNDATKEVADKFAAKDVAGALKALDKQKDGGFYEIKDKNEQLKFVADKLIQDPKDTLVLSTKRDDVKAINDKVRESLHGSKDAGKQFTVKTDSRASSFEKKFTDAYQKGDVIKTQNKDLGLDYKKTYRVDSIDKKDRSITLKAEDGEMKKISLEKNGKDLQITREEKKNFIEGDKVVFLKNDSKNLGVNNGELGHVQKIDGDKFTVKMENGKSVSFDIKEYGHLDHGYAITINKSQGTTAKNVYALLDSKNSGMNNYNSAYVALSRQKENVSLLTDDKAKLTSQISTEQRKTSTLDFEDKKDSVQTKDSKASAADIKDGLKKDESKQKDSSSDLTKSQESKSKASSDKFADVSKAFEKGLESKQKYSSVDKSSDFSKEEKSNSSLNQALNNVRRTEDSVDKKGHSQKDQKSAGMSSR